jgi:hypothetical protein
MTPSGKKPSGCSVSDDIDWEQPYDFLDKELHKILGDSAQGKMRVDALVKA